VDAYLAGVEHDVADDIDFDPLDLETTTVPGTRTPGPPGDQPFWVQQVSGSGEQELDWDIETGSYRFVLMNADGSAGVDTQAKFALKIPYTTGIIIGLLVTGGLGILVGVAMVALAIRSGPKPRVA
jgi:hypothetical protein